MHISIIKRKFYSRSLAGVFLLLRKMENFKFNKRLLYYITQILIIIKILFEFHVKKSVCFITFKLCETENCILEMLLNFVNVLEA